MRRTVGLVLVGLLALGAAFGLAPAHAASWTSSSYASRLIQLVNQARQQHGLPALTVTSGTSQVAAAWTAHLDSAQALSHNPDLRHQLETHGSPDWTTYGENVGDGPSSDPDALFKAYMNSTEHRDNILNGRYRYTGVSVILDGSTAWNTFDFVDSYHSSTQSTSTATKPKPKPSPTATQPAPTTVSHPVALSAPTATTARVTAPHSAPARPTAHRQPKRTHQVTHALPHTAAQPVAGAAMPNLAVLLAARQQPTAVLGASVGSLPTSLPASSRLSIAFAGLLVGFVGVRWWHVAREGSRAPRDLATA